MPIELRNPRKGLINFKNNSQKCFLWCHVRNINPSKENPVKFFKIDKKIVKHITNPKEIAEEDKKFITDLNYDGTEFPVQEKIFDKIEVKNNICINVFSYENGLVYPIYVSDKKFEDSMNLLLLTNDDKFHYVYIKDLNRFMFHKIKNKNENWFFLKLFAMF